MTVPFYAIHFNGGRPFLVDLDDDHKQDISGKGGVARIYEASEGAFPWKLNYVIPYAKAFVGCEPRDAYLGTLGNTILLELHKPADFEVMLQICKEQEQAKWRRREQSLYEHKHERQLPKRKAQAQTRVQASHIARRTPNRTRARMKRGRERRRKIESAADHARQQRANSWGKEYSYIHIGNAISLFTTFEQIVDFFSPIWGSDCPAPWAVGREYVYLLESKRKIRIADLPDSSKGPYTHLFKWQEEADGVAECDDTGTQKEIFAKPSLRVKKILAHSRMLMVEIVKPVL